MTWRRKLKKRMIRGIKKFYRFLKRLDITLEYNREFDLLCKGTSAVPDFKHPSIKEAKKYWAKFNIRLNPKWHAFLASFNNIHSCKYIPDDVFFKDIVPSLNNLNLDQAYIDKNMYDVFMQCVKMPKTLLRCMHGNFYDADYNLLDIENDSMGLPGKEADCFIKPTLDSGCGKNIKKCKMLGGKIFADEILQDINELRAAYKGEFIIQEGISQSPILSNIYPYSLNCIRSMSLRVNEEIIILSHLLKFGSNKKYVDNTGSGGVVCRVDGHGKVSEFAYDSKLIKIFEHPFTHKSFKNLILPNFGELERLIIQCHEKLPHFDLVAWDFGLDNLNQYVLIEHNLSYPGLLYHQVINGPIFKKHLDGILNNLHETKYKKNQNGAAKDRLII